MRSSYSLSSPTARTPWRLPPGHVSYQTRHRGARTHVHTIERVDCAEPFRNGDIRDPARQAFCLGSHGRDSYSGPGVSVGTNGEV
jgi:hypothetical protein